VSTPASGEHEERTRVICHLPINNAPEEKAFKDIINYLEGLRRKKIGVDGYTYSDPSAFFGRWWSTSPSGRGWMSDKITLLIIDFKIALTDPAVSLSEKITELKNTVQQSYAKYGRPQEEVWVIAHRVTRHT
jgi:hypothetical protein